MDPSLSVIICTHDRYEALAETLSALVSSRGFRDTPCEVLVVENTPLALREPIQAPKHPGVRVEICDQPGLSNARNFGIKRTAGNIVAFLDDDAIVCDEWCEMLVRAFAHPDTLVVGGKVVPQYPTENMPNWYDEKLAGYLSCVDWGPQARLLRPGEWIVGANMAFRRSVFDHYGLFDTELGRRGVATLLSNDETALLERVGMQRVLYSPEAFVRHMISSERITPRWFRRRVCWQAISDMIAGQATTADADMRAEYGALIGRLEAERRNLNALYFEPETREQFSIQLRAIYLATLILGAGGV